MKKIFVVVLGGLLVVALLWTRRVRREGQEPGGVAADTMAQSTATATALPTVAPPPAATASPPAMTDEAACARIAALCSTSQETVDGAACEKKLADARKLSGEGNVARSVSCVAGAGTCAAAAGCLSGGMGVGALGEYLKGLGSALSK